MELDPVARAQLETIADNWREVYPAGGTYTYEALRVLERLKEAGGLTGDDAVTVFMRVASYATHQVDRLELPAPEPR